MKFVDLNNFKIVLRVCSLKVESILYKPLRMQSKKLNLKKNFNKQAKRIK